MPRQANGRWDISRLWAAISIIGAVVGATIYMLAQVHDISAGQVSRHEQKSIDLAHPRIEKRLERIEHKLDQLRYTVNRSHGP